MSNQSETVESTTTTLDSPFWHGLTVGELRMQRCADCRLWTWPPQWRCAACGSWDMEWQPVQAEGIVYSFARNWHPFGTQMKGKTPFISVLVELPHVGKARLLGLLGGPEEGLDLGAAVVGFVEPFGADARPTLRWRLKNSALPTELR
jgi:uncharacterized OB-fold protein